MDRTEAFVHELAALQLQETEQIRLYFLHNASPAAQQWWADTQAHLLARYPDADQLALQGLLHPTASPVPHPPLLLCYWIEGRPAPGAAETLAATIADTYAKGAPSGFTQAPSINLGPLADVLVRLCQNQGHILRRLAPQVLDLYERAGRRSRHWNQWDGTAAVLMHGVLPHLTDSREDQQVIDRIIRSFENVFHGTYRRKEAGVDAAIGRYLARALEGDPEPSIYKALVWYKEYAGIDHFLTACRNLEKHAKLKPPIDRYVAYDPTGSPLNWTVHLLRTIRPPTQPDAARGDELKGISPAALITACFYAPSWSILAEPHLDWPGFADLTRWLRRYGGPAPWSEHQEPTKDEEEETGAIDRDLAESAMAAMGEQRLKQLCKHPLAKGLYRDGLFYLQAIRGENGADVEAKFLKRSKQAVRALGLLPDEGDTLQRYLALRRFAKEARQFGAKRQASEQLAVESGLANLAATTGYADLAQLEWAMETQIADEVDPSTRRWSIDSYTVYIAPDEKATLVVQKEGKSLKSTPPAVRQAPEYEEIKEAREMLIAQWDRVRRRLEAAMALGEVMEAGAFLAGLRTPAGKAMIPTLVLRCGDTEVLNWQTLAGESIDPAAIETVQVLHPLQLTESQTLERWRRHAAGLGIIQPLPQLQREVYHRTAAETDGSDRYLGRKVRVGTLTDRLKKRGWQMGSEGALMKRLPGRLYAGFWFEDGAAWYGPTEVLTVGQLHLDPKLSPLAFSEVMRDVDLATQAASPDPTAFPERSDRT